MSISPSIKYMESFTITGFSAKTQNSDEFNEESAKIPKVWRQFYTSKLAASPRVFGVYSSYDSDANGFYTVTVGVESDYVTAHSSSVIIQAGKYLVFQDTGPMPDTVVNTWKTIWEFFEVSSKYQRNFITDYEEYIGNQVSIYVGVSK